MSDSSWVFEPDQSACDLVANIRRDFDAERIDLAIILGSGWGDVFAGSETLAEYAYRNWPCFPAGQITGHGGRLQLVRHAGQRLLVFNGRFHIYQGLSAFGATFPVRLASAAGANRILLTCATGGVNPEFAAGDYMLVSDHLNLLGDNPLRGLNGEVFIDLSTLYQTAFFDALKIRAADIPANLHTGILAAMPGPSYETPAEVRMLASLGADVVSMSTVPEAIMARYLGMDVAALALIANPAAGLSSGAISHEDVLASGLSATDGSRGIVQELIRLWETLPITDGKS